jgi:hypothetical protein
MRKVFVHLLFIAAGAALGLAVGFALRGHRVPESVDSPAATARSSIVSTGKSNRAANRAINVSPNDDSPLATQLERDLSLSSGVTRWLYWLDAIERAAPSDFPRLARLAQGNTAAMRLVAARWVATAPRQLFDTYLAALKAGNTSFMEEPMRMLFEEWPRNDPEAAIKALNGPEDFGTRGRWRVDLASRLMEIDVERGLGLMVDWHIENFGPRMTAVTKWADADPRHAAAFALEHQAGYATELTLQTIGKEWAKTDPVAALKFCAGQSDGAALTLATAALKEWAARDFNAAADWLGKADARSRDQLSPSFVETWAKQDAAAALAWSEANLTGNSLAPAVGSVLTGAAEQNVDAAAALVAGMNPSSARAEAAVAVAKKWLPEFSSGKPAPPEAIAWLSNLDAVSLRRVLGEVQWQWSSSDPASMAKFLAARSSDQVPDSAYSILGRELARRNPTDALDWASRLPADRALSAGADAFAEWRRTQPEPAIKWLNDLPSGDPRRLPYFQSAVKEIAWSDQAAEQFAAMSATERGIARNVIEGMSSLPTDRRARLIEALQAN